MIATDPRVECLAGHGLTTADAMRIVTHVDTHPRASRTDVKRWLMTSMGFWDHVAGDIVEKVMDGCDVCA